MEEISKTKVELSRGGSPFKPLYIYMHTVFRLSNQCHVTKPTKEINRSVTCPNLVGEENRFFLHSDFNCPTSAFDYISPRDGGPSYNYNKVDNCTKTLGYYALLQLTRLFKLNNRGETEKNVFPKELFCFLSFYFRVCLFTFCPLAN